MKRHFSSGSLLCISFFLVHLSCCIWQLRSAAAVENEGLPPSPEVPEPPPAPLQPEVRWWESISLNAFASAAWSYDFNNPSDKLTAYRSFDYTHNSFILHGVELVLQRPVERPGDFGFRVDLTYGAIARGADARGLFRDVTTNQSQDIDLQQAYATYIVPIGRGLTVDAGKFVTVVGTELIDGYDGWNDQFSRSWLFTYGPFTHLGLRLSYAFHDKVKAIFMLTNGWDNVIDNNQAKSFGLLVAVNPHPTVSFSLAYLGGPERDDNNTDFRHFLDVIVTLRLHSQLTFTMNFDYGRDQNAITAIAATGSGQAVSDASWLMAVSYLTLQAHERLKLALRGELFYDFDGFRTGTAQRLIGLTLTPELKVTRSLYARLEGRIDFSSKAVFKTADSGLRTYQPTLATNAFYVF